MDLFISNKGGVPIYAQITDQIKEKILTGELAQDDPLPSIRLLAKELCISVITTKRAYEDLETAGFIYSIPGKGFFVAEHDREFQREEALKKVEGCLANAIAEAGKGGITPDEVREMLDLLLEPASEREI